MKLVVKICATFIYICFCLISRAQNTWPSPEIKEMYDHAQDYNRRGDYTDAAVTFKQIIAIAPDTLAAYQALAEAYIKMEKYEDAEHTIALALDKFNTDAKDYELLATSQIGQKHFKSALKTIKEGLEKFRHAGALYHIQGQIYSVENDKEQAVNAWVNGIDMADNYALNYKDAALQYLPGGTTPFGIIYGETYLSMNHDTSGDQVFKDSVLAGYRYYLSNIANIPTSSESFTNEVNRIFLELTPVISDGITTENLTMIKTRFIMVWQSEYAGKYPLALFSYEDDMIRHGHFDQYNEWLFGKAESTAEYNTWTNFHLGEMEDFVQWHSDHPLVPANEGRYNDKNIHSK